MLGSRPLSRITAFAPRRDSRREKPFHQELPSLSVASPKHNPKLPILSISYPSRFPPPSHNPKLPILSISYPSRFPLRPAFRTRPAFRLLNIRTRPAFRPPSRFPSPVPLSVSAFRPRPAFRPPCQYRYLSRFPAFRPLSRFPSPSLFPSAVPLSAAQPDLVCKSHWTAGKVGVRAHGAWDHEMFARDLGSSVFQCVAVPLVAQKSEMAVRADRLADGHKSFIPKRLDCVP